MTRLPPIVLVHGAWFGGWCWERVARPLRTAGHTVLVPDLPGRPGNPTPPFPTLEDWVSCVSAVVRSVQSPCVLVGHSLAGAAISEVGESVPDRVLALVYVAGFLLDSGQAPVDVVRADSGSEMRSARLLADDGRSSVVDPDRIADALCGDCRPEDLQLLGQRLVPESTAIAQAPVVWTTRRFGTVNRHYIECTRDRIITLQAQREMHGRIPCESVITLESSHLPFLAKPALLAAAISRVAEGR